MREFVSGTGFAVRPPTASVTAALGLLAAAVVMAGQRHPGMDSTVYRAGALAIWRGDPLYGSLHIPPPWADLPFTYPPVAGLVFLPLAMVSMHVAWGVMAAASALALGVTVRVCLRSLLGREPSVRVVGLLAVAPFALQPVWSTTALGQVNLLLMAAVAVDVLVLRGARHGGVLIGVAAAVKLTPLIFIPHLFLTGRRADSVRAAGTFLALQGLGWVMLPGDSLTFWTSAITSGNGDRTHEVANQSLNGLLQRLAWYVPDTFVLYAALVAACLTMAAVVVRHLHGLGQPLPALLVTAFCGLLVSPLSWTHHWVWVVPLCLLLGHRTLRRTPVAESLLTLAVLTFCVDFRWFVPHGDGLELTWNAPQTLAGNAYLLAATVIGAAGIGILATRAVPERAAAHLVVPAMRSPVRRVGAHTWLA
ncbi:MAG: glycosyltransferase 87 family protein [Micromonosporaceae bacterium]